ncbi:hypothetical protein ACFOOM_12090 [Streptomyces echinoruber]|uniref:HK97 gp10 family phage protein n=1 Tax=Streptomyces echinoruber TaxID=68898 RepID=A0A918RJL9_9ACTN|nr:hypothetical protein [Streptomyces echinoruber]GHA01536.1 hypothetical protein GCM10010389_46140 [Streptomyces echinoruber]
MVADVRLRSGRDLARIAAELRRMNNPELKKRFRQELRAAGKPMVPAVRRAIQQIPSKQGYRADGLRGRMSRAVKLEVRTTGRDAGVRLRVDGRKMPDKQKALQAYMEGVKKPWRHPVYGNREVWVRQQPKPYFYRTVEPMGLAAQRNIQRAADAVARDLT